MRKILISLVCALLVMGGVALAEVDLSQGGSLKGKKALEVITVRNGAASAHVYSEIIQSGEAVILDASSADGITVKKPSAISDRKLFVGIAKEVIATDDTPGTISGDYKNYGVVVVKGYVLASSDGTLSAEELVGLSETYPGAVTQVTATDDAVGVALTSDGGSAGQVAIYLF